MGVWLGPYSGRITENSFIFKNLGGDPGRYFFYADEDGHWELALLESGTLTWRTAPGFVDFCLVGAGHNGTIATLNTETYYIYAGSGGDSGHVYTQRGIRLRGNCQVTVGKTNGAVTELRCGTNTYTSNSGTDTGRAGATGSYLQMNGSGGWYNMDRGGKGVWLYGTENDESIIPALHGHRVAAGGGGGHVNNNMDVYSDRHNATNLGGLTDGANGGHRVFQNGEALYTVYNGDDANYYGNGGGGGYGNGNDTKKGLGNGGAGSQGIVVFRGHI